MERLPEVQRTEVDGVPTFWIDCPGPLTAHLVFGVGTADESFLTAGITQFVQRLVTRSLGDHAYSASASVGPQVTGFEVRSSRPGVVATHLERICRALAEVDLSELDSERSIAASVAEESSNVLMDWPLAIWFGNRGPGLVGGGTLGLERVQSHEVAAWWRRWFHRSNAALVLGCPPPAGLRLPLPDGTSATHATHAALPLSTPARAPVSSGLLVAAIHTESSAELMVGTTVLVRRMDKSLQQDSDLGYAMAFEQFGTTGGHLCVGLGTGVEDDDVDQVVDHLLNCFDELGTTGPTPAELELERAAVVEHLAVPENLLALVAASASAHLIGAPDGSHIYERVLTGLHVDDVGAALARAYRSMVLGVPEWYRTDRLPPLSSTVEPVAGRRLLPRPLFGIRPPGTRLVLGTDGLTYYSGLRPEATDVHTVRFADVVGVGVEPGPRLNARNEVLVLNAADGRKLPVRASDWWGGKAAVRAIRDAIPDELFFHVPERRRLL